ncbi:PASTA domain-containing protein [Dactylosporangium sp. NPDC005555]|uniref:PASTA domain-containing protein n=1 Tax=Dactylosporangium sp. NPDC005555 TaxID=3154889 RepID=UPI0033AEF034
MRHPFRAGLFAAVVAAGALAVAPAAYAGAAAPTDPAPPALYVLVPGVQGETPDDAKGALIRAGLTVGTVTGVEDCVNLGRVVKQDPAAKTLVLRGSAVNLTVGKAPAKGCEVTR